MRKIHVFVLRLLSNTDDPERLRGAVRHLADDNEHVFVDGHSLLALLKQMSCAAETPDPDPEDVAHPTDGSPKR